jgi:hypothetical protein
MALPLVSHGLMFFQHQLYEKQVLDRSLMLDYTPFLEILIRSLQQDSSPHALASVLSSSHERRMIKKKFLLSHNIKGAVIWEHTPSQFYPVTGLALK